MTRRPECKPSERLQAFRSQKLEARNGPTIHYIRVLIDQFPTVLAALAAFLTIAALIHEWGFYGGLGLSLGQSPIGVGDQFKILLALIPSIVRDVSIFMVLGILLDHLEDPASRKQPWRSKFFSPLNDPTRFIAHLFLIGAATLFVIYVLFRTPGIYPIDIINLLVVGLLLLGARPFLNEKYVNTRLIAIGLVTLLYMPFWLYSAGHKSALERFSESPEVTISLWKEKGSATTSITGKLLRSYDKQILIRADDGSVIFLPSEGIERIHFAKPKKSIGLTCQLLESGCNQ